MNLLLDTHSVLWWLSSNKALASNARGAIADPTNTIFLSAVVVWEIRIKEALGKLSIPRNFASVLANESFAALPITIDHAHAVKKLPKIHRDPFDRMLVAQAVCESMTIVSADAEISMYPVKVL